MDNIVRDMIVISALPAHFGGGGGLHDLEVLKELNRKYDIELVPSVTWNLVNALNNEEYKEKLLRIIDMHNFRLAEPVVTLLSQKHKEHYNLFYGVLLLKDLAKMFKGRMYKVVYSQSEFVTDLYLAAKIRGLKRGFLVQGLWFTKDFISDIKLELMTDYYKPWNPELWKRLFYRSIFRNTVYYLVKRRKFDFVLTVNPKQTEWNGLNRIKNITVEVISPGNAYHRPLSIEPTTRKEQYFVYYGRLVPTKGLFLIPKIVKEVVKECKDFKLYIFGNFSNDSIKNKFLRKIKEFNLEENVKYLGFLSEEDKLKVIGKAKGFLFPSLVDTYSISILESLSLMTAVITFKLHTLEWLYSGIDAVKLCDDLKCFVHNTVKIWRMNETEYSALFDDKVKQFLLLHDDWRKVAESEINLLSKFLLNT